MWNNVERYRQDFIGCLQMSFIKHLCKPLAQMKQHNLLRLPSLWNITGKRLTFQTDTWHAVSFQFIRFGVGGRSRISCIVEVMTGKSRSGVSTRKISEGRSRRWRLWQKGRCGVMGEFLWWSCRPLIPTGKTFIHTSKLTDQPYQFIFTNSLKTNPFRRVLMFL